MVSRSQNPQHAALARARVWTFRLIRTGVVHPGTGGISVAPDTANNLPAHRRPEALGGTGKDAPCLLNTADLPDSLRYVQDSARHGTIQPSKSMPLPDYQAALESTRDKWVKR